MMKEVEEKSATDPREIGTIQAVAGSNPGTIEDS
jgi:hypothetical protein